MATDITFNSYDLQSTTVITSDIDDSAAAQRSLGVYTKVRRGGGVITDDTYLTKIIAVKGKIVGTSVTNLEGLIDDFQAAMAVQEKNLDIDYEGGTRRWIATPQSHVVSRPVRAANWANFEIDFVVTEFGKNTSATTLVNNVSITSGSSNQSITIDGSAPEQYLLITVEVNSLTGSSVNSLTLKNNETSQGVTITRAWAANDTLLIDVAAQTVTVEGVAVDYTGIFPIFTPGSRTLTYTDDLTARNINLTATYFKRWL